MPNIIHTTKGPWPDDSSDVAPQSPLTSRPQGLGASPAASEPDLGSRIKTRRSELVARLIEIRDGTHLDSTDVGTKLKARLSEVAHIIKEGSVDDWANVGDTVKEKLERWLAETALQLAPRVVLAETTQP